MHGPVKQNRHEQIKPFTELPFLWVTELPKALYNIVGDRTSNLAVTNQPGLPPEPHAAHTILGCKRIPLVHLS